MKLQAEVTLQEEVTRLAQKRLAIKVLEAETRTKHIKQICAVL